MGTNYYLYTDVCPCCKREANRIHVGKSSAGWPFLFRGYRSWPPDGVPHPITSAQEWRAFIEKAIAERGILRDEYGKEADYGPLFANIERRKSETGGPAASRYKHGQHKSEWFDAEGYRFCDSEFS